MISSLANIFDNKKQTHDLSDISCGCVSNSSSVNDESDYVKAMLYDFRQTN